MKMSLQGYLRPVVQGLISEEVEKNIKACCPGVAVKHERGIDSYNVNWGPLKAVKIGYSADTEVRQKGSSGGVISALCIYLLESEAVDFVAQIAVSGSDPIANEMQISRTRADVIRAAGSRYAPSAPLRALAELLATGERFAFVGKPCDVAALRAFLRLNPALAERIPYLISFMCAGIPSIKATHEVVCAMGATADKLESFCYRGDGWPGMARAVQSDGQVFEMSYSRSWGEILNRHLQYRCKICADGTGELADVVCADAWYGKDGYPDFEEKEGRSLILARSPAGKALLDYALSAGVIRAEFLPISEISLMQPYQLNRKRLALTRGLATFLAIGRTTIFMNLSLLKAASQISLTRVLRDAWGTYRRAKGEPIAES